MRTLLLAAALGLAAPALPAQAFDFQALSDRLFGESRIFGAENPDARAIVWEDLAPPLSPAAQGAVARLNATIDTMTDTEIDEALALIGENGDVLTESLDGEAVSLEGYLVPLDFETDAARSFVLVPYMGACIHVPPPPPNQIVFVRYEEGIPMTVLEDAIWTPFRITGTLRAAPAETELADVGYQMTAGGIRLSEL